MNFDQLLKLTESRQLEVTADSRKVIPNSIFVAVKGTRADGHDFITNAISSGAEYIVCQRPIKDDNSEVVLVKDSATALAMLAQSCRLWPARKLFNLAVTGTNGKTTVGFLVKSIIENTGQKCGLIGTVFNHTGKESITAEMTTPGPVEIAQMQNEMVNAGAKYMMIEASSHALQQQRLAGLNFKAAAFTNLTGDHLDYHLTMENYLAAKSKLFTALDTESTAILNAQSQFSQKIADICSAKKIYYALNQKADIFADNIEYHHTYTKYRLNFDSRSIEIKSPLLGSHNISNHLAAAGLAIAADFQLTDIQHGLETAAVPGRLEPVNCGQNFAVLIDYAHTDDALSNVLKSLKQISSANLVVVFGCGGDRDKTKRPRMAKSAQTYADKIIVTNDNPRSENPQAIINDILTGFNDTQNITVEPDRKTAIEIAIDSAADNDIILIAGKGHEDYQLIGTEKKYFSDKQTAQQILNQKF